MKIFSVFLVFLYNLLALNTKGQVADCQISHLQADIIDFDSNILRIKVKLYTAPNLESHPIKLHLNDAKIIEVSEYLLHKKGAYPFEYKDNIFQFAYQHQPKQWHIELVYEISLKNNLSSRVVQDRLVSYQVDLGKNSVFWSSLLPKCAAGLPKKTSMSVSIPKNWTWKSDIALDFMATDEKSNFYIFSWESDVPQNQISFEWNKENDDLIAANTLKRNENKNDETIVEKLKSESQEVKNTVQSKITKWPFEKEKLKYIATFNSSKKELEKFAFWPLQDTQVKAYYPRYEPKNPLSYYDLPLNEISYAIQNQLIENQINSTQKEGFFDALSWKLALYKKNNLYKSYDSIQVFLSQQFNKEKNLNPLTNKNLSIEQYALSVFDLIEFLINDSEKNKEFQNVFLKADISNSADFEKILSKHLNSSQLNQVQYFLQAKELQEGFINFHFDPNEKTLESNLILLNDEVPIEAVYQQYQVFANDSLHEFSYFDNHNPSVKKYSFSSRPQTIIPIWNKHYPMLLHEKRSDVEALYELSYVATPYNRYRAYKHLLNTSNKNLLSTAMSLALDDSLEVLKSFALNKMDKLNELGIKKVEEALIREIKKSGPYERSILYQKAEKMGLQIDRPLISTQRGLDLYADLKVMHQYEGREAIEIAKDAFIEGNTDLALLWFIATYGDDEDLKFVYETPYEDAEFGVFAVKALALQAALLYENKLNTFLSLMLNDTKALQENPHAMFYLHGLWAEIENFYFLIPEPIKNSAQFLELKSIFRQK